MTTIPRTMRAIVYRRYGTPAEMRLEEVPTPEPQDGEVLVRIAAASLNALDWHMVRGKPYIARVDMGLRKPKRSIPGVDLAGTVVATGSGVTDLAPGDEVFANKGRALAEYVAGPARLFVPKPANLGMEQAASVPAAALTALQALRDTGQLKTGQAVLVYGAGGGVGTFSVQVAKALGATVTGVTRTENLDLVRSIGADDVVDYTSTDVTRSGRTYDLVLDVGATRSIRSLRRTLSPTGRLVLVGASKGDWIGPMVRILGASQLTRFSPQTVTGMLANPNREDLLTLKTLIEEGKITPVIDRTYPLEQAAEALAYLETMQARAKVVITI